jgi:hypothetical protein
MFARIAAADLSRARFGPQGNGERVYLSPNSRRPTSAFMSNTATERLSNIPPASSTFGPKIGETQPGRFQRRKVMTEDYSAGKIVPSTSPKPTR